MEAMHQQLVLDNNKINMANNNKINLAAPTVPSIVTTQTPLQAQIIIQINIILVEWGQIQAVMFPW